MTPSLKTWPWTVMLVIAICAALPNPGFTQTYVRGGVLLDLGEDTPVHRQRLRQSIPQRPLWLRHGRRRRGPELGWGFRHDSKGWRLDWDTSFTLLSGSRPPFSTARIFPSKAVRTSRAWSSRTGGASLRNCLLCPACWRRMWTFSSCFYSSTQHPSARSSGSAAACLASQNRGNPHGLSGYLYHRAGRQQGELVVDANGRIRVLAAGSDDGRFCLAIHGSRCHRNGKR